MPIVLTYGGRVPPVTKQEAAEVIATDLLRRSEGAPVQDPATWEEVAKRMGVSYEYCHIAGGARGRFIVIDDEDEASPEDGGRIVINRFWPEVEQSGGWVHELSHAMLHKWIPPRLSEAADLFAYSDDPKTVRHDIARMVESQVLWNQMDSRTLPPKPDDAWRT